MTIIVVIFSQVRRILLNKLYISYLLTAIILVTSCVTTKKSKQDVGWVGKRWHDMNARYNGIFNAKELIKETNRQLEASYEDNYAQILDIEFYGDPTKRDALKEDMDIVLEKVTKVAALHEPSKWVDDCYVLMGRAQYMKGDLESAEETLEYFVDDFNPKDPDSRVYVSPNREKSAAQRKKEAQNERKIQEEQRKQAAKDKKKEQKEKQKERKEAQKQREKERKERIKNRKKGIRTPKKTVVSDSIQAAPLPTGIASTNNNIDLDTDEAYIRDLERQSTQKKEEKEDNGGGLFKQTPAYNEGILWLAKTYISREKWIEANYFLDKLEKDPNVSDDIKSEVLVNRADYFLQQKDYSSAIPVLSAALEAKGDKKRKARMAFILAQIYQQKGESTKAYAAFDAVSDYKPSFEMDLQADISKFKNSWSSGKESSEKAIKNLNRLAKEDKYADYRGSIYSSMAEIALASGDEETAMEYFEKALGGSSNNTVKSEIYYRLATLFYNNERYYDAKLYYDSTLTIMDKTDERFVPTELLATNLTDIAKNISLIENQDSMLALSNMSEKELNAFAKKKAEDAWEANRASEEEASGGFTATTSVISGNSKFFAYNQVSKQKGRQEFLKRWGSRPLVDNWRLSSSISAFAEREEEEKEVSTIPEAELQKEINKVLREVPRSDERREAVNASIEKAMFELGTGFRTRLEKYTKSNETLLGLLSRFPATTYKAETYFFIYLNYIDLGDTAAAEKYRSKLKLEFPESDFTKFLDNPTGDDVLMTEDRRIQLYYDKTYELFENRQYQEAFDRIEESKKELGDKHDLIPKFDLLKAMCIGNLKGEDEYINALRGVILRHNNTPEQVHAREMMRFLRGDEDSFVTSGAAIDQEEMDKFVLDDDKLHYVIAVLYTELDGNALNKVKLSVNGYNESNHKAKRLRSTSIVLNRENKSNIILIRRFSNREDAMSYYSIVNENLDDFLDTKEYSYDVFAINQKNYREVMKQKSVNNYRIYFEQEYLGVK